MLILLAFLLLLVGDVGLHVLRVEHWDILIVLVHGELLLLGQTLGLMLLLTSLAS